MTIHTFTRAVAELADLAFPEMDDRGERVGALLTHIADGGGSAAAPAASAASSRPATARRSQPTGDAAKRLAL
jgi:hypothetical protein